MKRYQSHKIVEAAPIVGHMNGPHHFCVSTDAGMIDVPPGFFARGVPGKGDYLVRYDGDYLSWSPQDKFEAGYTEVTGEPDANAGMGEPSVPQPYDIAKIVRDAYGRGFSQSGEGYNAEHPGDAHEKQSWQNDRDAWIRQYMARLSVAQDEAAPVTGKMWDEWMGKRGTPAAVEVTVTAPRGKRAAVEFGYPFGTTKYTVAGGQSQTWSVMDGESLSVSDGKPHSNVEQVFSPD